MAENQDIQASTGFMDSKFGKVFLTVVSVFLIFAGPTYVVYALSVLAGLNGYVAFVVGFVLFAVGLVMMRFLVKNKVIS